MATEEIMLSSESGRRLIMADRWVFLEAFRVIRTMEDSTSVDEDALVRVLIILIVFVRRSIFPFVVILEDGVVEKLTSLIGIIAGFNSRWEFHEENGG